jgi:murein DD-endopeptidase MepM/ murein hydrolase activator NlpD
LQKRTTDAFRRVPRRRYASPQGRFARESVATRANRLSIRLVRAIQGRLRTRISIPTGSLSALVANVLRPFATAERLLPVTVAAIVAVAALVAFVPPGSRGAVGRTDGPGADVRVAIGGGPTAYDTLDQASQSAGGSQDDTAGSDVLGYQGDASASFLPVMLPREVTTDPSTEQAPVQAGEVLDDGTLLTGYAPDTTVEDGSDLIRTYKVKSGDTLVQIAHRFGVSMKTLWWANKLEAPDALHVGQVLRIPPVSGLVYTVTADDTLDTLAAKYKVDASDIVTLNGLEDPVLVVGQVLILPGAKGAPIPTPKPTPKPANHPAPKSSGSSAPSHTQVRYSGGRFHWPVIGGGNYISQYFHYGHEAIDIAADYGSKVVAAASGRVIFAGWKSNGGGYQVWISHGGNLYTTYNHMSAITVANGQSVGRGQQVGRIGQTGWATGPHLHFEVWIGPIWSGGTRVNPLRYF